MTTDQKLYTLIFYRPNGSKYLGCGDTESFDSEIGFEQALTFDQLRTRIIEHTKRSRGCCDSCSDNDNPCEFAILSGGQAVAARGDNLWSFATDEEDPELTALFDEAELLSEKEKREKAEAAQKAEEERRKKAAEERDRQRWAEAQRTITELKPKFEPRSA